MQNLTEKSILQIQIMFSDPSIQKELIDEKESNLYSKVTVDSETGEIVLGKTRFLWWNQLIGAEKKISLSEFVFKTVGALINKAKEEEGNLKVEAGLLENSSDLLSRQGRSNDVIDQLFLIGYVGVKTSWSCMSMGAKGFAIDKQDNNLEINLRINDEIKTFELPGSGDKILRVNIGPKDVEYIG